MADKAPAFGAYFFPFALAFSVVAILLREVFRFLLPLVGLEPRWALPAAVATAIVAMNQFPEERRVAIVGAIRGRLGGSKS